MTTKENDQAGGRAAFPARLWRGQVSLPWTFWVCGCGVELVLKALADWFLSFLLFKTSAQLNIFITLLVVNAAPALRLTYLIFISIAIWRSAARYAVERPSRKLFSALAKVFVVLDVCVSASAGTRFISQQIGIFGAFQG